METIWHKLGLSEPKKFPIIMGILNCTPDSFSDGGAYMTTSDALRRAEVMLEEGAQIIDVGGESSRPGATRVPMQEAYRRVIPVITAIVKRHNVAVSVDTSYPEIMQAAADHGARLINDVFALQYPGALNSAARTKLPVCLVHMQGTPQTMQVNPRYTHVVNEVVQFFQKRIAACGLAGIPPRYILLDPGFGFGKRLADNYTLLASLKELRVGALPILVGLSRKQMLHLSGDRSAVPRSRVVQSVVAACLAALKGEVAILRVHDVAETIDGLNVLQQYRLVTERTDLS